MRTPGFSGLEGHQPLRGVLAIRAHDLMVSGDLEGYGAFRADVISFSGLGDYVHMPVKTYSQDIAPRRLAP